MRTGAQFTFEFKENKDLKAIQKLIPMNCLVGEKDIIPGLVNDLLIIPKK